MDKIDDSIKNQIAVLWRVINATRCFKEDNAPCQIEGVIILGVDALLFNMSLGLYH